MSEGQSGLHAAASVGSLSSEGAHKALLESVAQVAAAIFSARAASIFLLDEQTDELVFEAIAGVGSDTLLGMRFPSSTGIAGWVLSARQPLVIEDVSSDPRWSREAAERTGYMPRDLAAVPLLHEERALGVLELLDRPPGARFGLHELDLLGLFANQAAIALDQLQRARRAHTMLTASGDEAVTIARLVTRVDALEPERRDAALRLLEALAELLS